MTSMIIVDVTIVGFYLLSALLMGIFFFGRNIRGLTRGDAWKSLVIIFWLTTLIAYSNYQSYLWLGKSPCPMWKCIETPLWWFLSMCIGLLEARRWQLRHPEELAELRTKASARNAHKDAILLRQTTENAHAEAIDHAADCPTETAASPTYEARINRLRTDADSEDRASALVQGQGRR